jgi:hypothetical protein
MNENHQQALRALDALLADDADMSVPELRAELEAEGVNVDAFLAKFSKTVRQSYQQRVRLAAEADARTRAGATSLFGELKPKTKTELIAICDQLMNGVFGVKLQQAAMARCRNHQGKDLSEEELRSWLEDISAAAPKP